MAAAVASGSTSAYGPADLVVNAAGVMLAEPRSTTADADEWQRMIDTNVTGALRLIRAFTGDLLAAAAEGRGRRPGQHLVRSARTSTFPNYGVYGATKAALTHLSQSLRTELGPRDVRITNVEPGFTESRAAGRTSTTRGGRRQLDSDVRRGRTR